jgi:uncharacterized OB-fold protein
MAAGEVFALDQRHVETEVVRAFTSVPTMVREDADCGAVSYPRRHLCWQCSSGNLGEYRLSRRGKIFTFAKDQLAPNPDPPTVMASADLEGGSRFYGQLTDSDPGMRNSARSSAAIRSCHPMTSAMPATSCSARPAMMSVGTSAAGAPWAASSWAGRVWSTMPSALKRKIKGESRAPDPLSVLHVTISLMCGN